jgi:hypothetical protein
MSLAPEQEDLRQSKAAIVGALGVALRGTSCKCPFHSDQHASASVHYDKDGCWRFHCFTCQWKGDVFDVRAKMEGRTVGDVLKETRSDTKPTIYPTLEAIIATYQNVETVYRYTHPETKAVELAVIRYCPNDRKQFAQCSPVENGWIKARPQTKLPLYNRKRVIASESVVVVEGEKAVHALHDIGIVATTSPMGAGKAKEADWSLLQSKTVYLWPDNDPADAKTGKKTGDDHMRDIEKILETMDVQLFWIDPIGLDLPAKGDAVDFIERNEGESTDKKIAVELVLQEAQPLGAAKELEARLHSIISGDWINIEWPWPMLTSEAQSLLPDTVTAMCGEPGAAKSFLLLESWWKWNLLGHRTAIFELEDDRVYHMHRVLAQLEQNALLTDTKWAHRNPEKVKDSYANQKDIIASLGKVMWDAPDKQVSTSDLADWFETRCQEGFKICIIDPVTAASASEKPWIDDQSFIFKVKTTAKRYHTRLIYAIHPRISNGKVGASLSRLAGGAAYPRFSHSVFWLTKYEKNKTADVWRPETGKRPVSFERGLKIQKARNGRGAGSELAFHLNEGSLCFEEYGSIAPDTVEVKSNERH